MPKTLRQIRDESRATLANIVTSGERTVSPEIHEYNTRFQASLQYFISKEENLDKELSDEEVKLLEDEASKLANSKAGKSSLEAKKDAFYLSIANGNDEGLSEIDSWKNEYENPVSWDEEFERVSANLSENVDRNLAKRNFERLWKVNQAIKEQSFKYAKTSEQILDICTNPKYKKQYDDARGIGEFIAGEDRKAKELTKDTTGSKLPQSLCRVYDSMLDYSGTEDAKKRNKETLDKLQSSGPEADAFKRQFLMDTVNRILSWDDEDLMPKNDEEAAEFIRDNYYDCKLLFDAEAVGSELKNYSFPKETRDALRHKTYMYQDYIAPYLQKFAAQSMEDYMFYNMFSGMPAGDIGPLAATSRVHSLDVNDFVSVSQISDAVESSMKADKERPNKQYDGLLLTEKNFIQDKPLDYIKKPDPVKSLFAVKPSELRFGIKENSRVAHILEGDGTELDPKKTYDFKRVSKEETFNNLGDYSTRENFLKLARNAALDYESLYANEEYSKICESIKSYVTAEGRSAQQESLATLNKQLSEFQVKNQRRINDLKALGVLNKKDSEELSFAEMRQSRVTSYVNDLKALTNGNLQYDREGYKAAHPNEKIEEPGDNGLGKIGIWYGSDKALFPHEPSPNDVKQGLGVRDCFMLSALTHIAATNPSYIKDAMKDNNDGTVTVRFYDDNKQEVFVTVNKTVNKIGGANTYASSSIWVGMMEKAYVKYLHEYKGKEYSFESIDTDKTYNFMNAFSKDIYAGNDFMYGASTLSQYEYFVMDENGELPYHPEGYLDFEEKLYTFLQKKVNENKETITVGAGKTGDKRRNNFALDHGIRLQHAYSIMKVFEANVDGKIKKFIQLRDPYAMFKGEYDKYGKLLSDNHEVTGTLNAGTDNMGTFNIELQDFGKVFSSFPGMKAESLQELQAQFDHCKKYTKDELKNVRLPLAEPEAKVIQELEPTTDLEKSLNHPALYRQLERTVKDLALDIASTDNWWVWTNTPNFVRMRDAINDLTKTMAELNGALPSTPQQMQTIVRKFREAEAATDNYVTAKLNDIRDKDKFDPSIRAVHRLSDAISFSRICKGDTPLPVGTKTFKERIGLVVNDINERCERLQNRLNIPHDEQERHQRTVEEMQRASESLAKFLIKNPSYMVQGVLTNADMRTFNDNINKMREHKIPEPQVINNPKPEKNKSKNTEQPDFSDFEILS